MSRFKHSAVIAPPPDTIGLNFFRAFTLAETLITLAIIGVVAAVVLPSLMTNINDKVNAEKIRSAKYKFTKATDHMKSLGLIGPYSSTDAFVDELQKI